MFVFSIARILLIILKILDNYLSDEYERRKEMVSMKKTDPTRSLFVSLVKNVWAVGIDIMAGVLSA